MAFNMVTKYAHSPKDIDHYNTCLLYTSDAADE